MGREQVLGELGNIAATPGSRDWAVAVRMETQYQLHRAESNAGGVRAWVQLFKEHSGYKALTSKHGKPFESFEEYCLAPEPYGLGCPLEVLEALEVIKNYRRRG